MIIDTTKTGIQNLLTLVNTKNDLALTEANVAFGPPVPRTPSIGNPRNTSCTLSSKQNTKGVVSVNFTRVGLTSNVSHPRTDVDMVDGYTLPQLKTLVVAMLNLVPSEVVLSGNLSPPPNSGASSILSLTANPNSYLYVGEQDITLNWHSSPNVTVAFRCPTSAMYQSTFDASMPWVLNGVTINTYPAGMIIPNGSNLSMIGSGGYVSGIFELVAVDLSGNILPTQPTDWTSPDAAVLTADYIAANLPDFGPPYYAITSTFNAVPANIALPSNFTATSGGVAISGSLAIGLPAAPSFDAAFMVTPGAIAAAEAAPTLPWKINGTLYADYPAGLLIHTGSTIEITASSGFQTVLGGSHQQLDDAAYINLSIVGLDGTTGTPLPAAQQPTQSSWFFSSGNLNLQKSGNSAMSLAQIQARYSDSGPEFYSRVTLVKPVGPVTPYQISGMTNETTPRLVAATVTASTPGYTYNFTDYAPTGQTVAGGIPLVGVTQSIPTLDGQGNVDMTVSTQAPLYSLRGLKVSDLLNGTHQYVNQASVDTVDLNQAITVAQNALSGPMPTKTYTRLADIYADMPNFMFPKNTQLLHCVDSTVKTLSGTPTNSNASFDYAIGSYLPGAAAGGLFQTNWLAVDGNGVDLITLPTIGAISQHYNNNTLGDGSYTGNPTVWATDATGWTGDGYFAVGNPAADTMVNDNTNTYEPVKLTPGVGSVVLNRHQIKVA